MDNKTTNYKDIMFIRGDTFKFNVGFQDIPDEPDELIFTIRPNENEDPIVVESITNGGVTKFTGDHDFDYAVRVAPEDTSGLTNLLRIYKYDLQVTIGSDDYTVLYGNCRILPDMTQPE